MTINNSEETLLESNLQNCSTLSNENSCDSSSNLKEKSNVENELEFNEIETNESAINLRNTEIREISGQTSSICIEKCNESINQDIKKHDSWRLSLNNTDNLNVTDYVNELLNKRNSGRE